MHPINIHLKEIFHDTAHAILVPLTAWFWNERRILKEVLENKIERRHHMGIAEILTLVEHGVPAIEAGWAALETQIPTDKADALAAWQAGLKAFGDIKGGIPVILAALRGAAGTVPTPPAA